MELNTLIRIQCYKQAASTGLKKNKQPCIGNCTDALAGRLYVARLSPLEER